MQRPNKPFVVIYRDCCIEILEKKYTKNFGAVPCTKISLVRAFYVQKYTLPRLGCDRLIGK